MKKVFFAILSSALFLSSCNDNVCDVVQDAQISIVADDLEGNVVMEYADEIDSDMDADIRVLVRVSSDEALSAILSDYKAKLHFKRMDVSNSQYYPQTFDEEDVQLKDTMVGNQRLLLARAYLSPKRTAAIGLCEYNVTLSIHGSGENAIISSNKANVIMKWEDYLAAAPVLPEDEPISEEEMMEYEKQQKEMEEEYRRYMEENGWTDEMPEYNYDGPDNSHWIKDQNIADNMLVGRMSLPGTHDSSTRDVLCPTIARTQPLGLPDQFKAGVRVFDFRAGIILPTHRYLTLNHGGATCKITFKTALNQIIKCLKENESEFAIVIVKGEGGVDKGRAKRYITSEENEMKKENPVRFVKYFRKDLNVGNLRGRILFINRWDYENLRNTEPIGAYVDGWVDNDYCETLSLYSIRKKRDEKGTLEKIAMLDKRIMQDYYKNVDLSRKKKEFAKAADNFRSRCSDPNYGWCINHTSCYKELIPNPARPMSEINPYAIKYIKEHPAGPLGFVMMDGAGQNTFRRTIYDYTTQGMEFVQTVIDQNKR